MSFAIPLRIMDTDREATPESAFEDAAARVHARNMHADGRGEEGAASSASMRELFWGRRASRHYVKTKRGDGQRSTPPTEVVG